MVFISQLIPNPAGKDASFETITLSNTSATTPSLKGWFLKDASGKTYVLGDISISSHGTLVLDYATTKLSLNNGGDTVMLFNAQNEKIDVLSYARQMYDDEVVTHSSTFAPARIITTGGTKHSDTHIQTAQPVNSGSATIGTVITGSSSSTVVITGIVVATLLTIVFWQIFKMIVRFKEEE